MTGTVRIRTSDGRYYLWTFEDGRLVDVREEESHPVVIFRDPTEDL